MVLLRKVTKMALRILSHFSATVHNEFTKFTKEKLFIQSYNEFIWVQNARVHFCFSYQHLYSSAVVAEFCGVSLRKGSCLFLKVSCLKNKARILSDNQVQQTSRTLIQEDDTIFRETFLTIITLWELIKKNLGGRFLMDALLNSHLQKKYGKGKLLCRNLYRSSWTKIWESFISWIICILLWSEALEFTSVN